MPVIAPEVPAMARNDLQVKIDADVVRKAKQVALLRDVTLAEYLSELLRPLVDRDLVQEQARQGFVPAAPAPPSSSSSSRPAGRKGRES